jgi:hypothetical protein
MSFFWPIRRKIKENGRIACGDPLAGEAQTPIDARSLRSLSIVVFPPYPKQASDGSKTTMPRLLGGASIEVWL